MHLDLCTLTSQVGHCRCEASMDLPQHPKTHGQVSITAPPSQCSGVVPGMAAGWGEITDNDSRGGTWASSQTSSDNSIM